MTELEEAIYQLKIVATKNAHGELYEAIRSVPLEEIQFALRLALRVMGEPSEGMVEAARSREDVQELYPDIFKAMRDHLLKEVRDDNVA